MVGVEYVDDAFEEVFTRDGRHSMASRYLCLWPTAKPSHPRRSLITCLLRLRPLARSLTVPPLPRPLRSYSLRQIIHSSQLQRPQLLPLRKDIHIQSICRQLVHIAIRRPAHIPHIGLARLWHHKPRVPQIRPIQVVLQPDAAAVSAADDDAACEVGRQDTGGVLKSQRVQYVLGGCLPWEWTWPT